MGEQGAESIHAHIMRLERIYQGIPNDVDRMKYIFKEQTLESAPSLTSLRPPKKKRRKTSTTQEFVGEFLLLAAFSAAAHRLNPSLHWHSLVSTVAATRVLSSLLPTESVHVKV